MTELPKFTVLGSLGRDIVFIYDMDTPLLRYENGHFRFWNGLVVGIFPYCLKSGRVNG